MLTSRKLPAQSKPYEPNEVFEVYAKAGASLLFVGGLSATMGCSNSVTGFSIALGMLHEFVGIHKNGFENSYAYASESIQSVKSKVTETVTAIKENEWIKSKCTAVSAKYHSLFAQPRLAKSTPAVTQQTNSDDLDDTSRLNLKKSL